MIDAIFNRTTQLLEKSMSLRMARHGLIASNVANAETPNYRALDINFEGTMAQYVDQAKKAPLDLKQTDPRHFSLDGLSLQEKLRARHHILYQAADSASIGNDNNSVDLEAEIAKSQENTLLYTATTQLLARKLKGLSGIMDSVSRY